MFNAATSPDSSVAENYEVESHSWDIKFKTAFGEEEMQMWEQLMEMVQDKFLSDEQDRVKWAFEKKGIYTTKSMYRWLSYHGVSDTQLLKMWKLKIPKKIKVLL